MKNKYITLLTIMLATFSMIGCSSKSNESIQETDNHVITLNYIEHNFISPGNNTVKFSEKYKHQFDNEENTLVKVNEIILTGNKKVYEKEEDIVKYSNKKYKGLYEAVSELSKPCTNEALVNFIVEYFRPRHDEIRCAVSFYGTQASDNMSESINEELEYLNNETDYYNIKDRYNTDVKWSLRVFDVDGSGKEFSRVMLYGCDSYIIGLNLDRTISKNYGQETIVEQPVENEDNTVTENTEDNSIVDETVENTEDNNIESEDESTENSVETESEVYENNSIEEDNAVYENNSIEEEDNTVYIEEDN